MAHPNLKLTPKTISILQLIAAGNTYEQILTALPTLTYLDIFHAAKEALNIAHENVPTSPKPKYTLAQIRERYPRAYEKWTDTEDTDLKQLIQAGGTVAQIATQLQRNRGAIRNRIIKLNLIPLLFPKEQDRLNRITSRNLPP